LEKERSIVLKAGKPQAELKISSKDPLIIFINLIPYEQEDSQRSVSIEEWYLVVDPSNSKLVSLYNYFAGVFIGINGALPENLEVGKRYVLYSFLDSQILCEEGSSIRIIDINEKNEIIKRLEEIIVLRNE